MRLRLIGVPTSAAAYGVGQELAPQALRDCGLVGLIDIELVDGGDLTKTPFQPDPDNPRAQNIESVVAIAREVSDVVGTALEDGDVPLVIGGDCTITLGVVAAVVAAMPDATLAYFDGDVDMSTPETTRSGVLDAMGVAHLLNVEGVDPRLAGLRSDKPLIRGEKLALIGYEAGDVPEEHGRLLKDRGVGLFPASRLRTDLSATLDSFDVDAVDSIELPLAEFPHSNAGVSVETTGEVLKRLCKTPQLAALVVTEANPRRDPNSNYMPVLARLIADSLNTHAG
jgi:arginase